MPLASPRLSCRSMRAPKHKKERRKGKKEKGGIKELVWVWDKDKIYQAAPFTLEGSLVRE